MPSGVLKEITAEDRSYYMASDIMALLGISKSKAYDVRKLNILSGRLYAEHGIYYKNNRTHDGRKIRFWKDDTETA